MENNNCLARLVFINAFLMVPLAGAWILYLLPILCKDNFLFCFAAVIMVVLVHFCFVPEKARGSREVARKPQLVQVGHLTCNAKHWAYSQFWDCTPCPLPVLCSHPCHIFLCVWQGHHQQGVLLFRQTPFSRPCLPYSFLKPHPL